MVNETIQTLTYEKIIEVSQHPLIIMTLIVIYLFVLICFILYGIFGKARTSQGRVVHGTRPIQKLSFWIIWFILWLLPVILIIIFLIFPSWVNIL